jgi:hypothetical protein
VRVFPNATCRKTQDRDGPFGHYGRERLRKPAICCAPTGPGDGALWALDASTGVVLNGGKPLIYTSGSLRVPPTIDGNWIFILDNNGTMYALTIDASIPTAAAKARSLDSRMLTRWQLRPGT